MTTIGGGAMSEIISAEIIGPPQRDPYYQVDNITAATLPGLCIKLLAAGFNPEASVECYRPGRAAWDIRAKPIRAAAELRPSPHGVGFVRCTASRPLRDGPSQAPEGGAGRKRDEAVASTATPDGGEP
jgi:hypothetical protein